MANTIAKAIAYLKTPEALAQVFAQFDPYNVVVKPHRYIGTDTLKYQKITYGSPDMGDFSRITGYPSRDITQEWITRVLTQDKGDSLYIDSMDDEESLANGIVSLANGYIRNVQVPSITRYRSQKFCDGAGIVVKTSIAANTCANLIIDDIQTMFDKGINTSALVLFVNPTIDGYLKKDAYANGHVLQGNWNGNMQVQVRMFDTAMIKALPQDQLGTGVQYMLAHAGALNPFIKFQEAEFFDKVPGYGSRRKQVDIGVYHDAEVEVGCENGVLIHVIAPTAPKMTPDGADAWVGTSQVIAIASDSNAKIYYTIGDTTPTDPTGVVSDTEFLYEGPITITATKSVKAIAIRWGVKSTVTSKTFTKSA